MHVVPLSGPGSGPFAMTIHYPLPKERFLPGIRCPLPPEPASIIRSRTKGDHFKDFEQQIAAFRKAATSEALGDDGLLYAHRVLGMLAELAQGVANLSPIAPKVVVITENDVIAMKFTTER